MKAMETLIYRPALIRTGLDQGHTPLRGAGQVFGLVSHSDTRGAPAALRKGPPFSSSGIGSGSVWDPLKNPDMPGYCE